MNVQEALKTLTEAGYVWKVWSVEDVDQRLRERINDEDPALSDVWSEDVPHIAADAVHSNHFKRLALSSDADWSLIDEAIDEVLCVE